MKPFLFSSENEEVLVISSLLAVYFYGHFLFVKRKFYFLFSVIWRGQRVRVSTTEHCYSDAAYFFWVVSFFFF